MQISDDDIIRWINDGQIEIVKNNDAALQKTTLVNLVANQSDYTVPTDLLILRSLRYKFSDMSSFNVLKYVSVQQFDETVDGWDGTLFGATSPLFFTMYEGKITLFPTPDKSSTGGLKILYNQKPADVTLLSELSLPSLYHNTIVKYCLWQATLLDEDYEPSTMYKADFANDLGTLSNRETKDPTERYPTITVLESDY